VTPVNEGIKKPNKGKGLSESDNQASYSTGVTVSTTDQSDADGKLQSIDYKESNQIEEKLNLKDMCDKLLTEKDQMAKRIQEQEDKLNALNSKQEDTKKDSIATHSNDRNIKGKIQTRGLNKKKIIDTDTGSDSTKPTKNTEKKLFVGMDNIGTGDRKGSLKSLEHNNNAKNTASSGSTQLAEIKCKNKSMCTPVKNDEVKLRPNIPKSASRVRTEYE
jgi:hypothetical protein